MPTYNYRCPICLNFEEIFHAMKEQKNHYCKNCHAAMNKLISAGLPPIFKGSGFFATDYRPCPPTSA